MNRLLILSDQCQDYADVLRAQNLQGLEIHLSDNADVDSALLSNIDIILGRPDLTVKVLDRVPKLKWIQSSFAGIEPFCESGLPQGCVLTGVKDIFGPLMSEYVFAYILGLERNIFAMRTNQRHASWKAVPYRPLSELTIGICGLGSIGKHLAATAKYFGMRVLGLSRSGEAAPNVERHADHLGHVDHLGRVDQVYAASDMLDFVSEVDYLVSVLPNTKETKHIINAQVLQSMQPSAVLINVGRGATVDENAVAKALENGALRAAVLDVFQQEPLDVSSPLWQLDNAYITPHNAAITFPKDIAAIFCENYERFCTGQPLKYVIDLERGY